MITKEYENAIKSIEETITRIISDESNKIDALAKSDKLAEDVSNAVERGVAAGFAAISARSRGEGVSA